MFACVRWVCFGVCLIVRRYFDCRYNLISVAGGLVLGGLVVRFLGLFCCIGLGLPFEC